MNQTAYLARRALLAVALMVGFYVLALATALVLLSIPLAEWNFLHRVDRLTLFAGIAGFGVLWAIVPRPDRFTPPGPRLDEDHQALLLSTIRGVASETGQSMPADVYLLGQANAFVTQRGGLMGLGSRRVMGIGLPLLQALTIGELRAVVAHEFGHYSAGDVALGPWIYKTRGSIGRAIASVKIAAVQKLFLLYGQLFMKLTLAVARRQELIADEVSARVAGTDVAVLALQHVAGVAGAHLVYMKQEVAPVLSAGFLPPLAQGFDRFLGAERVQALLPRFIAAAESELGGSDFDTHPPLAERLAALRLQPTERLVDNRPASLLLKDADRLASECFAAANGGQKMAALKPLDWDLVPERVHVARWRAICKHCGAWLNGFTAETLPVSRAAVATAARRLPGVSTTDEKACELGLNVLGTGLAVMLLDDGWILRTAPGQPFTLVKERQELRPFELVTTLADGSVKPSDWTAQCQSFGLTARSLWPI